MSNVRSAPSMRGEYYRLLLGVILREMARQGLTQDSLAEAVGMHQTTVGGILNKGKGTFDLDEADQALRHVGSSLAEFVSNPEHSVIQPRTPVSQARADLQEVMRRFGDDEVLIVLGTAEAVRARVRRAKKQSAPRRAVAQGRRVRKTGGTR